jgi:hypothetical protein
MEGTNGPDPLQLGNEVDVPAGYVSQLGEMLVESFAQPPWPGMHRCIVELYFDDSLLSSSTLMRRGAPDPFLCFSSSLRSCIKESTIAPL